MQFSTWTLLRFHRVIVWKYKEKKLVTLMWFVFWIEKAHRRCHTCLECKAKECGICKYCKEKPKNGGPGTLKKSCVKQKCTVKNDFILYHHNQINSTLLSIIDIQWSNHSKMIGDGNCFYSGISYQLFGTQEEHQVEVLAIATVFKMSILLCQRLRRF